MPRLTDRELTDFLDEPGHLLRLATIDESGMPRIAPVWFLYQDDAIVFTPRARSVFLTNLRRDPRIAVAVDEEALPYRKLSAQGEATTSGETPTGGSPSATSPSTQLSATSRTPSTSRGP
ncbi:MAG: pyridoxamine 5'-phosphate oxidase family protein [Actinomycetota bacterium]|nr:pyridoxamine 5'-phosphate oxidase family protein [Actinomycetota bacterium]